MELRTYLQSQIGLNQDIVTTLNDLFIHNEYPKYHTLLSVDGRSNDIFFIEKGLVRTFYHKDEKEITDFFFKEGTLFCSVESIFLNQKSTYHYELLENSIIRSINYSVFESFLDKIPELNHFTRKLMAYNIKLFSDRLYDIQFQLAEHRYKKFIETSPDLLQRAPLKDIASYLGITQQTLSVVRGEIFTKKSR